MPTTQQITVIQTLLAKTNNKANKEMMVQGFTANRTTSLRALTAHETVQLINHLKAMEKDEPKAEKMRRKLIAYAHEMNWHLPGTRDAADMPRIDAWCKLQFGKKNLNGYTYKELPKLLSIFEKVYKHYLTNL